MIDDRSAGAPDAPEVRPTPECPGCGEPDVAGDDFCHECGHSFDHLGGTYEPGACPMCATGSVLELEYGRRQCDACGYTARDEG